MNSTWQPATTRQFLVAGWSADGGATFDPAWMTAPPSGQGGFHNIGVMGPLVGTPVNYFALSMIALGEAGGPDPVTGLTIPALVAFSGTTILQGFGLFYIPEPSTAPLAGLAAAVLLIFRRRTRFGTGPTGTK